MNTTIREFGSVGVVFEWRPPIGIRLGLGAMLFLPAVFFGYYLFSALLEYIRVASLGEWLAALPGITFVTGLFLLFAVPCWIVFVGRFLVMFDRSENTILKALDLRVYRWVKSFPLDKVQHVSIIRHKVRRRYSDSAVTCSVLIRLNNEKPITVSHGDKPVHARMIAEKVAGYLGVSAL